ncbi:hypothetical protein V6N13_126485 [Hibiscus sabdariffa]|uniref:Uncharacterized protein n=1 Tax=Hibiscus sabdariffa TaxID=183260 RepID=A0ABR2RFJ3_9ROSI
MVVFWCNTYVLHPTSQTPLVGFLDFPSPCLQCLPDEEPDIAELELPETPSCDQKFGSNDGFEGIPINHTYLLENDEVILRLLPIWAMLLMFAFANKT